MIFTPLGLQGAYAVDLDRREDARGFFARLFCAKEFADHGMDVTWTQCNTSFSHEIGTLRGLHFQRPPMAEAKLVKCIRGAIFDVLVDLRRHSPTFGQWTSLELSADNRTMAYVPPGFAHGFQTLARDTELLYFHSQDYSPAHEGGVRFDDLELNIGWPLPVSDISPRDAAHPYLAALEPIA
jgi:dTDP-4-dehydrorhamnose 3,5-epimerase